MKNRTHLKCKAKFILASVALCLALYAGQSSAQVLTLISPTVNDGGFESVTSGTGVPFTTVVSATSAVPYWGLAGGTVTDSGAQNQGAGGNTVQAGSSGSYYKFTDSPAFNLASTYTIKAGDRFTLTWYASSTGNTALIPVQTVTLFSQAQPAAGASYSYAPVRSLTTTDGMTGYGLVSHTFTQFTLTYTATAVDAGNSIGLTIGNSGAPGSTDTGNTFMTADSFNLSVTSVPEPSTCAFICASLGGLALLRHRRPRAV